MASSEISEEDVYDVERIINDRMYKGKKQYLIKWIGYPESDNTWEFKSNLFCTEMLQEYEKNKKMQAKMEQKPAPKKEEGAVVKKQPPSKSTGVPAEPITKEKNRGKEGEGPSRKNAPKSVPKAIAKTSIDLPLPMITGQDTQFERIITNEWHDVVEKVTGAYFNPHNVLEIEFVTVNGVTATCPSSEMRFKAPLKLLDFYEENLTFPE